MRKVLKVNYYAKVYPGVSSQKMSKRLDKSNSVAHEKNKSDAKNEQESIGQFIEDFGNDELTSEMMKCLEFQIDKRISKIEERLGLAN